MKEGFPAEWLENLLVILIGKHNEIKEKCQFPYYLLQDYFWLGEMLMQSKKGLILMSQCDHTSVYDPKGFFPFLIFLYLFSKYISYCFGFGALWSSWLFGQPSWIQGTLSLDSGPRKRIFVRTGSCYALCPLGKVPESRLLFSQPSQGPASPWEV